MSSNSDTKAEPVAGQLIRTDGSPVFNKMRHVVSTGAFNGEEREWPGVSISTGSGSVKGEVCIQPSPAEVLYLSELEVAKWRERVARQVLNMDDLTADMLDIVMNSWLGGARTPEDMVAMKVDDILRMRGLKEHKSGSGRRGGYDTKQRKDVVDRILALSDCWIRIAEMDVTEPVKGKRRRTRKCGLESRALVLNSKFGEIGSTGEILPESLVVRPGDVFTKYLVPPHYGQVALMAARVLQYDTLRHKWEKRLGRYLSWQWRIRQSRRSYLQPFTVETLLGAVGQTIDGKHPLRTKERFEAALNRLCADGVVAGWRYADTNQKMPDGRGWSSRWLKMKIVVEPPQDIVSRYNQNKRRSSQVST